MSCPNCQESARFLGYRPRTLQSLLGVVRIRRAYYHCRRCRGGTVPWDQTLGLHSDGLTPAAREVVCLAGAEFAFAAASELVLPKLAGLHASESTVERLTEATGCAIGQRLENQEVFGPPTSWAWHRDAEGRSCGYVGVDATGVGQQGPGGAAAEGRMATVAMVYNPVPEQRGRWADPRGRTPQFRARYVASLEGVASLGEPLRRQAAQVGLDRADRWIAISDGGAGLEDWLRVHFGRVEAVILDYYHAAEYLGELAHALHGGDESAQAEWLAEWCHRLKHEGGPAVLEELRGLSVRDRSAREVWTTTVRYFENQAHRMDYPSYLAKGWAIGSGPVESACKTVIGQRLKGSGMRWGSDGADALCHIRALVRSGDRQWDAYWHPSPN